MSKESGEFAIWPYADAIEVMVSHHGSLRTELADSGYTTLSIQLPVLGGSGKIGDYIPLYPDARERFQLAAECLKSRGYRDIAIVSHSRGATMANQYLCAGTCPAEAPALLCRASQRLSLCRNQ